MQRDFIVSSVIGTYLFAYKYHSESKQENIDFLEIDKKGKKIFVFYKDVEFMNFGGPNIYTYLPFFKISNDFFDIIKSFDFGQIIKISL
jgi:cadmium resistance protein CadD (predicted permease)